MSHGGPPVNQTPSPIASGFSARSVKTSDSSDGPKRDEEASHCNDNPSRISTEQPHQFEMPDKDRLTANPAEHVQPEQIEMPDYVTKLQGLRSLRRYLHFIVILSIGILFVSLLGTLSGPFLPACTLCQDDGANTPIISRGFEDPSPWPSCKLEPNGYIGSVSVLECTTQPVPLTVNVNFYCTIESESGELDRDPKIELFAALRVSGGTVMCSCYLVAKNTTGKNFVCATNTRPSTMK